MQKRETLQAARALAEERYDAGEQLAETLATDEEFGATALLYQHTVLYVDAAERRGHDDARLALDEARLAIETALDAHYDRIVDGDGVYDTKEARV